MVAYSFNTAFIDAIVARTKRQTIRLPRRRHAQPGERIQLYTGMRTKHCRRIVPDPLCIGVDEVEIDLRDRRAELRVNGIPVVGADADAYAVSDGFGNSRTLARIGVKPFAHMVAWWATVHGQILFQGVAIRWQPDEAAP